MTPHAIDCRVVIGRLQLINVGERAITGGHSDHCFKTIRHTPKS